MNDQGQFWLYDTYDNEDGTFLGRFDTMKQVQKFCQDREKETNGEFWPLLMKKRTVSEVHYGRVYRESRLCVVYDWTY